MLIAGSPRFEIGRFEEVQCAGNRGFDVEEHGDAQIEQDEGDQLPQQIAECLNMVCIAQMVEEPAVDTAGPIRESAAEPEAAYKFPDHHLFSAFLPHHIGHDVRFRRNSDFAQIVAAQCTVGNIQWLVYNGQYIME